MSGAQQEAMDTEQEVAGASDVKEEAMVKEEAAVKVEEEEESQQQAPAAAEHAAAGEGAAEGKAHTAGGGNAGSKRRHREEGAKSVKLGYQAFDSCKAAKDFFRVILAQWPKQVDVNEYEYLALLDLLKHHPTASKKIGVGIAAFQVRPFGREGTAFFAIRKDNSVEDFSYLKCLAEIYPGEISIHHSSWNKGQPKQDQHHDKGQGRGRGQGGRGRGGRGGRGGGRGRR